MNITKLKARTEALMPDPPPPTILVCFLREDGMCNTRINGKEQIISREEADATGDHLLYISEDMRH